MMENQPQQLSLEARIQELEQQLAEANRQLDQEKSLQEDGHRFRHLMFYCVDWHKNGKDDDAVMLSFGPYKSHALRSSLDEAMVAAASLRQPSQVNGEPS